ncbi:uncharacterized protein MYCFIDRAFT_172553 [Pseudocercospora fijiensis CIRAD86]|uniref:Uncharacterized protein n=1 Tax=Pseudocercospora fijiensis (strain CIRAD86) TaxID=383855 RepID=M3BCH4_PSEFD|nr:uncharacterized protein MYCFIDRAFT_172553 [Pseudocercospora fijiensis CIRAD86]EME86863.1 hypothetical protein MYCFIDRAFT_172553 [Pseudocercospora fijiensis CIRAD86]
MCCAGLRIDHMLSEVLGHPQPQLGIMGIMGNRRRRTLGRGAVQCSAAHDDDYNQSEYSFTVECRETLRHSTDVHTRS